MARWLRIFNLCLGVLACFMQVGWSAPLETPCQRSRSSERWLEDQVPQWRRWLAPLSGYEEPRSVEVCLKHSGHPRADYAANRIWLRRVDAEEDRRSLVHEYLHLAFKHSPIALDEVFIETTARQVLQGGL